MVFFFFQAEDGIRDLTVTGVQTCALPICCPAAPGNATLAPPAESRPGRSRPLRVAGDLLRTAKGTRLVKALAFGACRPSYANRAPYGCRFLSTRVLLSWSLL